MGTIPLPNNHFRYSPRDVFTAVFDFLSTTDRHQQAFRISFAELEKAVSALAIGRETPQLFHRILTLSPVYPGLYLNNRWKMEFKSDWVAKCVLEGSTTNHPFETYSRSKGTGRILSRAIHSSQAFTDGGPTLALFNMASNELDSPRFVIDEGVHVGLGYAESGVAFSNGMEQECCEE